MQKELKLCNFFEKKKSENLSKSNVLPNMQKNLGFRSGQKLPYNQNISESKYSVLFVDKFNIINIYFKKKKYEKK